MIKWTHENFFWRVIHEKAFMRPFCTYPARADGVRYNAFTIEADNCAIPNLAPHERGLLRLDISGDCVMNGGGEEFGCLEEFDCVLITGSGTLRIENASGLSCGGATFPFRHL